MSIYLLAESGGLLRFPEYLSIHSQIYKRPSVASKNINQNEEKRYEGIYANMNNTNYQLISHCSSPNLLISLVKSFYHFAYYFLTYLFYQETKNPVANNRNIIQIREKQIDQKKSDKKQKYV